MSTEPTGRDAAPTTPTPAALWRKASTDGELYALPGSGHVARLRRPSLTALATVSTGVPNPLSDAVLRLLLGRPATDEAERAANFRANAQGFIEVAALCLVEPRLALGQAPSYDAGEIGPGDLSDLDYTWLYYSFVEGPAADAATFRVSAGAPEP